MSEGSGFEICQIIGQNQARVKFFQKSLFGGGSETEKRETGTAGRTGTAVCRFG